MHPVVSSLPRGADVPPRDCSAQSQQLSLNPQPSLLQQLPNSTYGPSPLCVLTTTHPLSSPLHAIPVATRSAPPNSQNNPTFPSQDNTPAISDSSQQPPFFDGGPNIPPPTHHIPATASHAPSSLPIPFPDVEWQNFGLRHVTAPPVPNPNLQRHPGLAPRYNVDYQWICAMDGSFQGQFRAEGYRNAGTGCICHNLVTKETWFAAKTLPTKNQNSAPVAEAEATLQMLQFITDQGGSSALFIHDAFDMHGYMVGLRESKKKGSHYEQLKEQIKALLGRMDTVWCSHVHSHQGSRNLAENTAADQLASLLRTIPNLSSLPFTKFNPSLSTEDNIIAGFKKTYGSSFNLLKKGDACLRNMNFPFLSTNHPPACDSCGCPSHTSNTCFMRTSDAKQSILTRIKPVRKAAFSDAFSNPESIDWQSAPTKLDDHSFVLFMSTMFALCTRAATILQAWHALLQLCRHYYYSVTRRCLIRKQLRAISSIDDPNPDANFTIKAAEASAHRLHSFAKIAEHRDWKAAMNYIHKTERINPLDERIQDEWKAIHPDAPSTADILHIPYEPSTFKLFQIDRKSLSKKIAGWSVANAPGLTGFPPSFLIHFNNLTARYESDKDPSPYFTSLLVFIEHLASGKLFQIRDYALNYRGSFLNKLPPGQGLKVRNLGMSETFMRLASYSVLTRSMGYALSSGMLTKDDLGSCVSGGVEKFIKAAQMCAANPDVVCLSADFNKAYNNVLRTDTWEAIKEINYTPLTQWFIYAYGDCPSVTYVVDFNIPLPNGKVRKVCLPIGFPQGDNLSGFLFSITIRYIFRKLVTKYAALSVRFGFSTILDDTLLSLHRKYWAHLGNLVDDFVHTFSSRNLKIQTSKTDLYCRTTSSALQHQAASISCGIQLHNRGLVACRVPVSHNSQFICEYIDTNYAPRINSAYDTMLEIWSALEFLPSEKYNTFYIFVRLCFSSKFTYWLRNLLPQHAEPVALKVDECVDKLMDLLYPSMPGPAPTSALHRTLMSCSKMIETLPLAKNGAGVIRTLDIVPICHFSVVAESFSYVCKLATLPCWHHAC